MQRPALLLAFYLLHALYVYAQSPQPGFARHHLADVGYIDLPERFVPASGNARRAIDAPIDSLARAPIETAASRGDHLFVTDRLNNGHLREPDAFVMFRIETSFEEAGHTYRLQDSAAFSDEELAQLDAACRESTESILQDIGARMVSWRGLQHGTGCHVRYECLYEVPGEVEFQLICQVYFNHDRTHTLTLSGPRSALARDARALESSLASFTVTNRQGM